MNGHADIHLSQGNTSLNMLAERINMDGKYERDNVLSEGCLDPSSKRVGFACIQAHLGLVSSDIIDVVAAREEQSTCCPPNRAYMQSDQVSITIQTAGNKTDHEDSSLTHAPGASHAISKEVPQSECFSNFTESASVISITDSEDSKSTHPLLPTRMVTSFEASADDRVNCIQIPHTELDPVPHASTTHPIEEKETGDFDYCYKELPSSLPPSSSPPQLLSSSPCASSQSSVSGVEPAKMLQALEMESHTNVQDYPHNNDVMRLVQDGLNSESSYPRIPAAAADVGTTDRYYTSITPPSRTDDGVELSRKRTACQSDFDESYRSPYKKHPKMDSGIYLPPAPKRATLVSQHRQFKKLIVPFRPPLKAQAANDGKVDSSFGITPTISHDKIDTKRSAAHLPPWGRASKTSRSVSQFKSPLVNRVLPAESCTIRLTPALQALERKLQLLKRAVKVKEDKEEEVLATLTGKWIEAGREVAYDVWDATKDAGDFERRVKAVFARKSYGWESNDDGNVPWGWDIKPEDTNEESCGLNSLVAAGRPIFEEGEEVSHNTMGTMLRQLGIVPEIFGWDDDKEAFSD